MADEQKHIERCQKGEREAFGKLYDFYVQKIYSFVYYKVFSKETAEDILSDVFFKAFERINSYDQAKGPFSAWLYTIARNAVIDHYRTVKRSDDIEDYFDLGEDDRTVEALDAKETLSKVSEYLKTLSPKQREVVTLRVWQELPYKEIALIIGGTEASAKMAFSRAVKDIKEKFGPAALALLLICRLP